jgi:hypothetical protein
MQLKKRKEKSIVEPRRDKLEHYCLVPNVSVGPFIFGNKVTDYLDYYHNHFPKQNGRNHESYSFFNPPLIVFISDLDDYIESITCKDFLFFKNENLIGMNLLRFIQLGGFNPIKKERLYVDRDDHIRSMMVYDFDDMGLLLWTYRNKVIFVSCSKLK